MLLKSKLFLIADLNNNINVNVEGREIAIQHNGQKTETKLSDIISEAEYDDGEIYGNSLLSYYNVMEDGSLEVPGSKIMLIDVATDTPILIKKIERPFIKSDDNIYFEDIKKFAEFFKIEKPEEVFTDLSDEEKQWFISDRQANAATAQADPDNSAEEAAAASEKEKQLKLQAEADLKATIDPEYVQDYNQYVAMKGFYGNIGYSEHVEPPYHVFYGNDPKHAPCVLIKRGENWWQELKEAEVDIDRTGDNPIFRFMDGTEQKELVINIATGQLTNNVE